MRSHVDRARHNTTVLLEDTSKPQRRSATGTRTIGSLGNPSDIAMLTNIYSHVMSIHACNLVDHARHKILHLLYRDVGSLLGKLKRKQLCASITEMWVGFSDTVHLHWETQYGDAVRHRAPQSYCTFSTVCNIFSSTSKFSDIDGRRLSAAAGLLLARWEPIQSSYRSGL